MKVNKSIILLGVVHIIILVWILYVGNRPVIEYGYHHFASIDEENSEEDGGLPFREDENGTYLLTPLMDLPAGSYSVKINYDASESNNTWNLYSVFPSVGMSVGNTADQLKSGKNEREISFQTWLPVPDFAVKVSYGHAGTLELLDIEIKETKDFRHVTAFLGILVLLILDIGSYFWSNKNSKLHQKDFRNEMLILFGIVLLASIPLFTGYLVKGHDLRFHLTRILGIAQGLQNGEFPVRLHSNWLNGYGYPVSVFYGDLLLYLPALLKYIGFTLEMAYTVYVIFINCLTAFLAFFVGYRVCSSKKAAFVASAFYTLAPYRLVLLYTRAAVGEYTAYAFYPILFYGLYLILMGDTQKRRYNFDWMYLTAGFTMLIQSHVLSTEIAGIFAGGICLVLIRRVLQPKRLFALVKVAVSTFLLNLYFILPFLDYMRGNYSFNSSEPETLQMWGLTLSQLLTLFPGSRGYAQHLRERISYGGQLPSGIGFAALMVLGAYLWYSNNRKKEGIELFEVTRFAFVVAIAALFMTTVYFPWDMFVKIPVVGKLLFGNIQYPIRFLGIAFLFLSLVALGLIRMMELEKARPNGFCALLIVGIIISSGWYTSNLLQEGDFLSLRNNPIDGLDISFGEYLLPHTNLMELNENYQESSEDLCIGEWKREGNQFLISCSNSEKESRVLLPVFAYKYWIAMDKNTESRLELAKGDNNRLDLKVPGNYKGTILVEWKEPYLWRAAEGISLITLLLLAGMLMKKKLKGASGAEE